jgi:hypothetical protein
MQSFLDEVYTGNTSLKTQATSLDDYTKCSFTLFGPEGTSCSKIFECKNCQDEMGMCSWCLIHCHREECLKKPTNIVEKNYSLCHCGQSGHANKITTKTEVRNCDLAQSVSLFVKEIYICESDCKEGRNRYCYFCFNECHKNQSCDKTKVRIVTDTDSEHRCDCNSKYHVTNDFILNPMEKTEMQKKIPLFSRMYSNMIKRGHVNDYLAQVRQLMDGSCAEGNRALYFRYDGSTYVFATEYLSKVKFFYFFPDQIYETFSYERVRDKILKKTFKEYPEGLKEYKDFLFNNLTENSFYFTVIFHINHDFKNFRKLSLDYYLNSTIADRFKLKYRITNNKTLSHKYQLFHSNDSLKALVIKATYFYDFGERSSYSITPLLKTCLKLNIFEIDDLKQIIKNMYKHADLYNQGYNDEIFEILCLIAFSYNDAVLLKKIETGDNDTSDCLYLHAKTKYEETEMLLKMLLYYWGKINSLSSSFDETSEKRKNLKFLVRLKEVIKLFTLEDNSFSYAIDEFKTNGLNEYKNFKLFYKDLMTEKREVSQNQEFLDMLLDLQKRFETECEEYYYYEPNPYFENVSACFASFADRYNKFLDGYKCEKPVKLTRKENRHLTRIQNSSKGLFPFVYNENFIKHISDPSTIEIMKISNIEKTLFMLIESFYGVEKTIHKDKTVEYIFSFITLYCLNKQGLRSLLLNNVLKKIRLCLKGYESKMLDIIYIILKGFKIFQINIGYRHSIQETTHDVLQTFLKQNLNGLKEKNQAIIIFKVLFLASDYLDFELIKEMKRCVFYYLKDKGLMNRQRFIESFPNLDSDKYSILHIKNLVINHGYEDRAVDEKDDEKTLINKMTKGGPIAKRKNSQNDKQKLLTAEEEKKEEEEIDKLVSMKDDISINEFLTKAETKRDNQTDIERKKKLHKLVKSKFVNFFRVLAPVDIKNEENYLEKKSLIYIDQKIYMSFFKMMSDKTYYLLKNEGFYEIFNELYEFNNMEFISKIFSKGYLSIDQRTNFLRFLYNSYFIDVVGEEITGSQTLIEAQEYADLTRYNEFIRLLNDQFNFLRAKDDKTKLKDLEKKGLFLEQIDYMKFRTLLEDENVSKMKDNFLKGFSKERYAALCKKEKFTKDFISVLEILTNEFDNILYWVYSSKSEAKDIERYIKLLVHLMRYIGDYFWDSYKKTNIYGYLIVKFYKLTKAFVNQVYKLEELYKCKDSNSIKEKAYELLYSAKAMERPEVQKFNEIEDYFDIINIYRTVLQVLDSLSPEGKAVGSGAGRGGAGGGGRGGAGGSRGGRGGASGTRGGGAKVGDKPAGKAGDGAESAEANLVAGITGTKKFKEFCEEFDTKVQKDYFTIGTVFTGEFLNFYHSGRDGAPRETEPVNDIFGCYHIQFKQVYKTNIFSVLGNMSTEESIRQSLVDLFINYIKNNKYVEEEFEYSLINIITKILYYDTEKYQNFFLKKVDNDFFINYFSKLQVSLGVLRSMSNKFYLHNGFIRRKNMKVKIMLLFLQQLGEGFFTGFADKIFRPIEISKDDKKNFLRKEYYYNILKYEELVKEIADEKEENGAENPEDNANGGAEGNQSADGDGENKDEAAVAAVEEVVQQEDEKDYIVIYKFLYETLSFVYKFYLNLKNWDFDAMVKGDGPRSRDVHTSDDHLMVFLSSLSALVCEYNGVYNKKFNEVFPAKAIVKNGIKEERKALTITGIVANSLFLSDIVFNKKTTNICVVRQKIINSLQSLFIGLMRSFVQNNEFYEEGNDCVYKHIKTKINKPKLFNEIIASIKNLATRLKIGANLPNGQKDEGIVAALVDGYATLTRMFEKSLTLRFSVDAFKFIQVMSSNYDDKEMITYFETVRKAGSKFKFPNDDQSCYDSETGYRFYQFFCEIVGSVSVAAEPTETYKSHERRVFFLRPPFTFFLSNQTKQRFIENVDRSAATSKLKGLIDSTDYFVFEMFLNYHRYITSKLLGKFKNFTMYSFELFNYMFVIIHQLLLISHFYKKKTIENVEDINLFSEAQKFSSYEGNYILSLIQIAYIGLVLIIWLIGYSRINYQFIIMKEYKINFIISSAKTKKNEDVYRPVIFDIDFIKDNKDLIEHLNDSVRYIDKARIMFINLFLLNREINTFVLDLMLLILYLTTKNSICLVIPIVFITNLSSFLYDILYVVQMKWQHLCLVLIYTYLLVYLFTWVGFLYLPHLFVTETVDVPSVIIF